MNGTQNHTPHKDPFVYSTFLLAIKGGTLLEEAAENLYTMKLMKCINVHFLASMSSVSPCSLTLTSSVENPRDKGFTGPVTDEISTKGESQKKNHPPV